MDVIASLRARGIPAELDIIGETRPECTDPWIRMHGRLSYERLEHYTKLQEIYARYACIAAANDWRSDSYCY